MVNTKLSLTKQERKKVDVCSKGYISWIRMMLDKKVERTIGFNNCIKKSSKKINRKDIENCKKLSAFFDVIQEYAENGYITRYYADSDFFSDMRYYIYYDGVIFVLQKEISNSMVKIRVYEALDIDITSNWRDVVNFNDVINNVYSDEIRFRINIFERILNDNDEIDKIKSRSLYESKKDLLDEIKKTGKYKIPIKVILEFLRYVKYEL